MLRYLTHIRDWYRDPFRKRPDWAEITILGLTIVIVLIYRGQLKKMTDQLTVMQGTLEEQKRSGQQTTDQVWRAIDNLNWAARSMDWSQKSAQSGIEASENQSKQSLDVAIANSRLDERPWVIGNGFKLDHEPNGIDIPHITIDLLNTGKTPALDMIPISKPYIWNISSTPLPMLEAVSSAKSIGILAPGQTGLSFDTNDWKTTDSVLAAYNAQISLYYVRAKISYTDVNHAPHWTTICVFHEKGKPLNQFSFCSEGNEVDRNK